MFLINFIAEYLETYAVSRTETKEASFIGRIYGITIMDRLKAFISIQGLNFTLIILWIPPIHGVSLEMISLDDKTRGAITEKQLHKIDYFPSCCPLPI